MAIGTVVLEGHYEASDLDALADLSPVASWPERDGGLALTQATGTAQPVLMKVVINGKSALRFDGTKFLGAALYGGNEQPRTRTFVATVERVAAVRPNLFGSRDTYQEGQWGGRDRFGNENFLRYGWAGGPYGYTGAVDEDFHVITFENDPVAGTASMYIDGTLAFTADISGLAARSNDTFWMGADGTTPAPSLVGYVAAFYSATEVGPDVRAALHSRAQDEYGIAVSDYTAGGDPIPEGAATGATSWTGAASGTAPTLTVPTGTATGATTWAGSATGDAPTIPAATGTAAGTAQWTGAASGTSTRTGAAAGSVAWAGAASGASVRKGTAGGTHAWSGTASGTTTKGGTAVGAVQWAGAALGFAPVDGASGVAAGSTTWAGTATGQRHPKATATGLTAWAATATGTTTRHGTATGTTTWTGTAHAEDIDGWVDITVTGTLTARRWTATLTPRTAAGALHDRRWTGALP